MPGTANAGLKNDGPNSGVNFYIKKNDDVVYDAFCAMLAFMISRVRMHSMHSAILLYQFSLSDAGIVSQRQYISSHLFHRLVDLPI